ncbi:hypothetical protein O3M35_009099 [Rhynocoris fuscipes]|uniref:Uncharacterized protein n=1 Tax=Rhynocoris fuscipes TaxID=488301 RepID=A0AAW1D330_9HEMI
MKLFGILLFVFACIALIYADTPGCGRHGDPCDNDNHCCTGVKCHRYAKRCQVQLSLPPRVD